MEFIFLDEIKDAEALNLEYNEIDDQSENEYFKTDRECRLTKLHRKRLRKYSKYYQNKYNECDPEVIKLLIYFTSFTIEKKAVNYKLALVRILNHLGKINIKIKPTPLWNKFVNRYLIQE